MSTSHCLGLALKSYSICSGCDMQEITRQLAYHANRHAHELTEQQLEIVIEKLIKHQGDSGVLELKDDLLNENTN
ncbi:hypothetical protein [Calothrix sp. CCY 0018]|uniref:hypothetical protein n=1 Tax=Calothrix sp. CCY 0018 TaxID=3103864 RepID=UPI0039C71A24